jgi:hypothetical protein
MLEHIQCPKPVLPELGRRESMEVSYPVSYTYNGGIFLKGGHYKGYIVPEPDVPDGCEIVGIGVGLQLNAQPPHCTRVLRRKAS